jgi:oligogalacturonide lyase
MAKGQEFHDRQIRYTDAYSGREVLQLTGYLGHSNHLYFTDPCWFNEGRSLVFASDRANQPNLFRYDLDSGRITQLTDLQGWGKVGGCYCAANHCQYFWWRHLLYEVNVDTLAERVICEAPPGKYPPMIPSGRASASADGKYIVTMLLPTSEEEEGTLNFGYRHFLELFEAKPLTQLARIEIASGTMEILFEDRCYLRHENTSPSHPELMTFCHEGPWERVEQRIWGVNILTGEVWKIRDQAVDNMLIGHEYWFDDGEHIGYHGGPRAGTGEQVFGWVKWDNSERHEERFPFHSTHFHSLDERLIVGDGTAAFAHQAQPFIQLFRRDGEGYVGPKLLAYHRSSFNDQHAHPHPRFTPDGRAVLYTSDLTGYSNLYRVEIGDFDDLPDLTPETRG